jgi:hypothetical protein
MQPCFYGNRSATLLLCKPLYNPAFMETLDIPLAPQLCCFKSELCNSAFMDTALALQLCCFKSELCNSAFMDTALALQL